MILIKKLDLKVIDKFIEDGFIRKAANSNNDLFIYNYTEKTQYEKMWISETLQCRGLICDALGTIIARPFPKFFNLEEYQDKLPNESFKVYEKMDGSLGILYFYDDKPYIASRGSFGSEQAIKATELLHTLYSKSIPLLNKEYTYLFEIIYPANRIVVNYGDEESLVLLGVINTSTGEDLPNEDFNHLGFPIIQQYQNITELQNLERFSENNKEGFVIRFNSGLRIKFKFEEYVKLHAIVTQITAKRIWERLKENKPFDEELLKLIPDELYAWTKKTEQYFKDEYRKIELEANNELRRIIDKVSYENYNKAFNYHYQDTLSFKNNHRKQLAKEILSYKHSKILFSMLDSKNYISYIWNILEPLHEIPVINGMPFYKAE